MTQTRSAWTVVCDDVRQEVGNKLSLMGIYSGCLILPSFPVTLPKLAFVISARTCTENPFKELQFRILRDNTEVLVEGIADVSTVDMSSRSQDEPMYETAVAVCTLSPFHLTSPCKLSVRIQTESEELKAGSISVQKASQPLDKATHELL